MFRPAIRASIKGPLGATPWAFALIDSGSEYTLAGPWIPQTVGVTPTDEVAIGIGGQDRLVTFADVTLRISRYGTNDQEFVEWRTEIGFFKEWDPPWAILFGQLGFFDQFTVTMHRGAMTVALEEGGAFDERFEPLIVSDD